MPLTQEDAERIGGNIGAILGFGEKRKARLDNEALQRKAAAQLLVEKYLAEQAMERLRLQEEGDDRRAKLTQDREDYRERTRVGVMSDNAQLYAAQRAKEAADELARRRTDDAMGWWIEQAKLEDARRKEKDNALTDAERLAISAGNAERQLRDTGLTLGKDRLSRYGIGPADDGLGAERPKKGLWGTISESVFGTPPEGTAGPATEQPILQSRRVQPSTGAPAPETTPAPMPPKADGSRVSAVLNALQEFVTTPPTATNNAASFDVLLNGLRDKRPVKLSPSTP